MPSIKKRSVANGSKIWGITRISLGLVFLWAFFDKLIGLGFSTCRDVKTGAVDVMCNAAWLQGGSPTRGFLEFGTSGPLADFYQSLASTNPNAPINWLFMLGLLGIGVGLVFGIGVKLAVYCGVIMMLMMWSASLWPATNPIIDDHIIYALVLVGLLKVNRDQALGLGQKWSKTGLVRKCPVLR